MPVTKKITVGILFGLFIMLLIPPWKGASYTLLFDPPSADAVIDFDKLFVQALLLFVGAAACLLASSSGKTWQVRFALPKDFHWFRIILLVNCALLLWALGTHPYDYYVYLRCITFSVSLYGVWLTYTNSRHGWSIPLVICAVLYNPILKITFTKSTWGPINICTALFFLSIAYLFSLAKSNETTPSLDDKESE